MISFANEIPYIAQKYFYLIALGKVVSGYRIRNGQWTLIGRQSPQLPQVLLNVHRATCSTHVIAFNHILFENVPVCRNLIFIPPDL